MPIITHVFHSFSLCRSFFVPAMPPQKRALVDGQQKLTFLFSDTSGKQPEATKDVESECEVTPDHRCNASASSDTGNSCTSRKSARRFSKPWKVKFAWLSYCNEIKSFNGTQPAEIQVGTGNRETLELNYQ